jgi:hypothetical protein
VIRLPLKRHLTDLFLGPDEGLGFVVICFDVGIDVLLELFEICEGGAAKRLPVQDREPYLDLVELRRAGRHKMKLQIGMGLEPMLLLVRKSRGDAVHGRETRRGDSVLNASR